MNESNKFEVNFKATGHNRDQQADEALFTTSYNGALTWVGVAPQGSSDNEL